MQFTTPTITPSLQGNMPLSVSQTVWRSGEGVKDLCFQPLLTAGLGLRSLKSAVRYHSSVCFPPSDISLLLSPHSSLLSLWAYASNKKDLTRREGGWREGRRKNEKENGWRTWTKCLWGAGSGNKGPLARWDSSSAASMCVLVRLQGVGIWLDFVFTPWLADGRTPEVPSESPIMLQTMQQGHCSWCEREGSYFQRHKGMRAAEGQRLMTCPSPSPPWKLVPYCSHS